MMQKIQLGGLFFLSGASALVYELIWQRELYLLFGVSTLAVSAVLAAFMGGLALGAWLLGPTAERTPRPLRFYALLEAGVAAAALLVFPGFGLLETVYTALFAWIQPTPGLSTMMRFGLASLLLLVPTMFMGGTYPLMRRLSKTDDGSATFSLLYGINTLGAVVGAALTGFVFLRYLGMHETLWLAVGINVCVAAGAGSTERPPAPCDASPATQNDSPALPSDPFRTAAALGCGACLGAVTAGLEVTWTRILGIFTSNSAYTFALVLCVLLAGMGLGSLVHAVWARRRGDSWFRLAGCQWLLAGVTLAAAPWLRTAPHWLERIWESASPGRIFLGELALTTAVLFVPAVLMGFAFPALIAAAASSAARVGRIVAANTFGFVVGAIVAGFVSIPDLGLRTTLGVCAAGSLAAGVAACLCAARPTLRLRMAISLLALLAAGGGAWFLPADGFNKSALSEPYQRIFYREGDNGTVSVVEDGDKARWIMVDGQPVAGTAPTSVIDQKMLAHLPLLLHPQPRRALTVGFGSGGTSYSMSLHGVRVDCVEIEAAVPAAADLFRSENHDIRQQPSFRLILDDARSYLRVAPAAYDVIATDCTNIQYKSSGDLYTVDYFRLMKTRLTEHGVAAAWVPANGIDPADLKTLLRSFQRVFPHTSVWYMNTLPTDFLIVVGTPDRLAIDVDTLRRRMAEPAIRADLEEVGLAEPYRLLNTLLTADDGLAAYLGSGPLNTDDRPVLSYSTYGASLRSTICDNLIGLMTQRREVGPYLRECDSALLLLRHHAASNAAVLGDIAYHAGRLTEALQHYVQGSQLLPDDPALRRQAIGLCLRLAPR